MIYRLLLVDDEPITKVAFRKLLSGNERDSRSARRPATGSKPCIRFHYTEKITLDDVAKAVNLNPSYLCRLIKKETGESLFGHITSAWRRPPK